MIKEKEKDIEIEKDMTPILLKNLGMRYPKEKSKKKKRFGYYLTALEAAKAYETYVRLNNLEHNFTPALTEDEIEELNKGRK